MAYLCHEVRNPFAAVTGWAECIVSETKDNAAAFPTNVHRQALNICSASNHISSILDSALSHSKNEYLCTKVNEHFDLGEVFKEVATLLEYLVQDEVIFTQHINSPIWVSGDATIWKQLLV
jgi:light-regulated signal transduction histidine kinase (bacteriophytochrome)